MVVTVCRLFAADGSTPLGAFFKVEADDVMQLRDAVKAKKSPELDYCAPDRLVVSRDGIEQSDFAAVIAGGDPVFADRYLRDLRRVLKPGACFIVNQFADLESEPLWRAFSNTCK